MRVIEPRRPARRRSPANVSILLMAGAISACCAGRAWGRTDDPDPHEAQPERPTVATHAGVVARGWIEIETGGEFDRYADRLRGGLFPTVVKLGVARRLQLNVQPSVVRAPGADGVSFGDLTIGLKMRLLENAPGLADVAILPSVKVPSGSTAAGSGTGTTDVGVVFISSRQLGPVSMDVNVGYTHRSGSGADAPRNATVWTASCGGGLHEWLGWTAELYGYPRTSGPAGADSIVAVLVGPTFRARPWLVFDAGVIAPVSGPQPRAIYGGLVYNVGRLW